MGRELKRVPIDFDWPLKEVWEGYLNPCLDFLEDCPSCDGSGLAPVAKLWRDKWYGYAVFNPAETGSLPFSPFDMGIQERIRIKIENPAGGGEDFWFKLFGVSDMNRVVFLETERMCKHWNEQWSHHLDQNDVQALFDAKRLHNFGNPAICPPAPEVNWLGLTGMGHDAINQHVCLKARIKRMGEVLECASCEGDGHVWPSTELKELCDNWEETEPPEGEGWQVWETVTGGSPVSPVFVTEEELQNWLIHEKGYSEGAAEQFTKSGWVPSGMMVGGRLYRDIESLNMAEVGDDREGMRGLG